MLATAAAQLPTGAAWSYEVKWDGYRTLALKDGPRVKLLSRNLKDAIRQYPSVAREVARLQAESMLLRRRGCGGRRRGSPLLPGSPSSSGSHCRLLRLRRAAPRWSRLTSTPLDDRRDVLARVLDGSRLLRSEPLPGTPSQIENAVRELRLEGVVAKRRNSRYDERCARAPLIRLFTPPVPSMGRPWSAPPTSEE